MIRLAVETLERSSDPCAARSALDRGRALPSNESSREWLVLLASLIFTRPDVVSPSDVARVREILLDPGEDEASLRLAGDVLSSLMTTGHRGAARAIAIETLRRPESSGAAHQAALACLAQAALWARDELDGEVVIGLAELDHLSPHRPFLVERVVEPVLLGNESVADVLEERWIRLYEDPRAGDYIRFLRAGGNAPLDDAGSRFPLHRETATPLRQGRCRILMVHNIKHGQGDEIVRCVPLLQSLLDANPETEITIVTRRLHLYAHPRITAVSAEDPDRLKRLWRERFDAVIDFFEPFAGSASSDGELEDAVQAYVARNEPFLLVWGTNRKNQLVFERVEVGKHPWAAVLGLDRRRVRNVYDTSFRLIAELGLPLRTGEKVPRAGWVLAGESWKAAEISWSAITERNHGSRPVAMLNPYGGGHALKGYVDAEGVAAEINRLVEEGFYVIVMPSRTAWGTSALAAEAVQQVPPGRREWVAVGPDLDCDDAAVTPVVPRLPPLSASDYATRLALQWIRRADLVVTVEGWVVHAAYCLGKPYRALMLPYSEPGEWSPFAESPNQRVFPTVVHRPWTDSAASLPHPPRKQLLVVLLEEISRGVLDDALPLLRRSLRSPDRDVRAAAARSLVCYGHQVTPDLVALLEDPSRQVRAVAAAALLDCGYTSSQVPPEHLTAHVLIGKPALDWIPVAQLGRTIRPVLETASRGDEPSVRREAALILRYFEPRPQLAPQSQRRRSFIERLWR